MALLDQLLEPILSRVKQAFAPFGKLFSFLGRFWNGITSLGEKVKNLISLVVSEVEAWRNFRENIAFRTKVISLPAAIEHISEFWQQIKDAWAAVIDLVHELKGKFAGAGENPTQEVEEAIADIQKSGFKSILEKFPRLLKGAEKVLGVLAILVDALESIIGAVDDLTAIVEALRAIRENVETAQAVFLGQGNPRVTLTLQDGSKIRKRVPLEK